MDFFYYSFHKQENVKKKNRSAGKRRKTPQEENGHKDR